MKHEKSEILAITYRGRCDVIRQKGAQVKVSIELGRVNTFYFYNPRALQKEDAMYDGASL